MIIFACFEFLEMKATSFEKLFDHEGTLYLICILYPEVFFCFRFCNALEKACVDTVDDGIMTKDLAGCIYGLPK